MRLALLLALAALASPAGASSLSASGRGTAAGEFLELGVDARAVAMGGAFTAVCDGASAMAWNPAGLTGVERRAATFMHAAYLNSSYFDYGAYAQSLGAAGALGASVQYFSAGSLTQTDITGADVGRFAPYDLAAAVGYAGRYEGASFGAAAKFIDSRILATARTGAVDLGAQSAWSFDDRARFGFSIRDLGGKLRYEQDASPLPTTARLGAAVKLAKGWLGSVDAVLPSADRPYAALGTEYLLADAGPWKVSVRAGLDSRTMGSIDGLTGVSFGLGVGYQGGTVDYALVPMGGLGQAHRISLGLRF